jgi:hypothetical protein
MSNTNAGSGAWRLTVVAAAILLPALLPACDKKGQTREKKTVQKSEDDFLGGRLCATFQIRHSEDVP